MAYTTINKSTDYFNTKLYTGNGGTQSITGVGHKPDLVWVKQRNGAAYHQLTDAVRGVNSQSASNDAGMGGSNTCLTGFNSDGFALGSNGDVNANSKNYVSWNWKANGQGSSNTDGTINSTYTSASTTSGFSIVQFTGTGANATVGHGLGVAPTVIITRPTSQSGTWRVFAEFLGNTQYLTLNTGVAQATGSTMWNGSPTSSVFTLGSSGDTNGNNVTFTSYCFAEKQGFSKFGSYVGNGNADGAFTYTGFKPSWVLIKNTATTSSWYMYDNKRPSVYNPNGTVLFANEETAESTNTASGEHPIDFLSNGFKIRTTSSARNGSGNKIFFMAFAEAPLVGSNNLPANAR